MLPSVNPLAALGELERRYNGPVPVPLRQAAQLGSAELARLRHAEAEAAFLKTLLRGQVRLIRRRRDAGSFHPSLLADLRLYRRRWRHWRRRVLAAQAALSAQHARAAVAAE
ncbi:MAG TPA: hypothetical protein VN681_12045 [Stellaceae bacterium]|nr:hypothetical protein [Stellaceae bacterium]